MTGATDESASIDEAMDAMTTRADYPLYVVTASAPDGTPSGCLIGFVTQCSINPPRFLVCISKVNHTYTVAEHSAALGLHLLGSGQLALGRHFAEETGDTTDKFAAVDWAVGVSGAPVLGDCAAWVEGPVVDRWSVGDHEAFLLRPTAGGRGHHDGLLMLGAARSLEPAHPATA